MEKHSPIFFLTFIILNIFGCQINTVEKNGHTISIDLDKLLNVDKALPNLNIESIIHLDTKESSLFGDINRIELSDGKIYILDVDKSKAVFVFSTNGDFINKTDYGKGPGEMINPYDLFVDSESNLVYVWDQTMRIMMKYSLTLNHLGQEKFEHPLNNFIVLNNDQTLISTHFYRDFIFKIFGPDNETVEQEFIPDMEYAGGIDISRSISKKEKILLIAPYQYNIYELKDNQLNNLYFIDFGRYNLTPKDIEEKGIIGCLRLGHEGKRVSSLNDISAGHSFLTFRVYFKKEVLNFAYSFKDQKPYLINEYVGKNMLPACTVRGITEDDLFYAVVEPEDLDNFQKETGKILVDGEIDLESNPYLITFSLGEEGR